ncbi:MAG TPA: hypothetical protein VLI39_08820 [Sedimentisphaerales bacterium]|nr:hypothetical protein [Sedimentisphaerales bacterium]
MPDVLRVLLRAAGGFHLAIRLAGFLGSLAEGVASCRPHQRFAAQRRSVIALPWGAGGEAIELFWD